MRRLALPRLEVPRLGLASFRRRILIRGVFLLLALATLALAVVLLQDEKDRSYRNYQQGFRRTQAELMTRLTTLRRSFATRGAVMPEGLPGLGGGLDYGRIRDALVPMLHRQGGMIAARDPDGHLFVIRGSQKTGRRQ